MEQKLITLAPSSRIRIEWKPDEGGYDSLVHGLGKWTNKRLPGSFDRKEKALVGEHQESLPLPPGTDVRVWWDKDQMRYFRSSCFNLGDMRDGDEYLKYAIHDWQRAELFEQEYWHYIYADIELQVKSGGEWVTIAETTTYSIESDSDPDYIASTEHEYIEELKRNFSDTWQETVNAIIGLFHVVQKGGE